MKTAIVLGATGLVGSNLVGKLANSPRFNKVIAVTRRPVVFESSKVVNEVVDLSIGRINAVFLQVQPL